MLRLRGLPLRPLAKEAKTLSSYNYYDGKTEAEFWGATVALI